MRIIPTLALLVAVQLLPSGTSRVAGAPTPEPAPGADKESERELHLVGLYEGYQKSGGVLHGGRAVVAVNRPGKRVTLVLSAYDSITWEIKVEKGTELNRVILCGYHRQAVKDLPDKVELLENYAETRKGDRELALYTYQIESAAFRRLVEGLHRKTGLKVASFHGAYAAKADMPIHVDRVQAEPRFLPDWPMPVAAGELPALSFKAHHWPPARMPFETLPSYGDFTLTGPVADSLQPLPRGVKRVAYDAARKKLYGMDGHGIGEVDLTRAAFRAIPVGLDVPRISWPTDIAFDTKRSRVLLLARGLLYAYEPATDKWSALNEGLRGGAITYRAKDDAIYAVRGEREMSGVLLQLNAQGAVVRSLPLIGPIVPGVFSDLPFATGFQLVAAGDHLVLLALPGGRLGSGDEGIQKAHLYLLDPETGKARLAWKDK